ncbi:MAG: hypothetical protein E6G92_07885 [Alphaproteobacteria bacterium]|jgi:hypothetical protein|nr:MAG: hypothetical protein E6G92_07885 [Alphaproteobacteria bacterium]
MLSFLAALVAWQSFPELPPSLTLDGHFIAPQIEGAYRFDCGFGRAEIRWRQERFDPDSSPSLSDALRVTLLQFSVPERGVSPADLGRIRAMLERMAWIESATAWCYPDRSIDVWLRAMPKRDWVRHIERGDAAAPRPEPYLHVIKIAADGTIRLEQPEEDTPPSR